MNEHRGTSTSEILGELGRHAKLDQVTNHPFLRRMKAETLTKSQVNLMIGQYWYPIHYFTEYLPRAIAVVPDIDTRAYISKILWQELGQGDPAKAHERLYIETMTAAGMELDSICNAAPLPASKRLVDGYRDSTQDYPSAIGFLYGTEVIDLAMVSALGAAVSKATGLANLSWVDIHVQQEPDHVASVRRAVVLPMTEGQRRRVVDQAQAVWGLWSDFYYGIQEQIDGAAANAFCGAGGTAAM
jgi:pyrroloquinoline quinone (PQQ) biosynthesis protein C